MARSLMHPPAVCPSCGAGVSYVLFSDPSTPAYSCGSTPTRIVCAFAVIPDLVETNLSIPTDAELADFAYVVGRAVIAWTPDPRIGLCTVIGCDATAIYGSCLDHSQ